MLIFAQMLKKDYPPGWLRPSMPIIFSLLVGMCAHASPGAPLMNLHRAFLYHQNEYLQEDASGDEALCLSSSFKIKSTVQHFLSSSNQFNRDRQRIEADALEEYPELRLPTELLNLSDPIEHEKVQQLDLLNMKPTVRGRAFSARDFSSDIKATIDEVRSELGIEPSLGQVQDWSPRTRSFRSKNCKQTFAFTKLLVALAYGSSGKYFFTGTENALTAEIVRLPLRSLLPKQLFRMSYILNGGNVYKTLLTIENVLSKFWDEPNREERRVSNRLAIISHCNGNCSNFGYWYHLYGETLYGYAHGSFLAYGNGVIEGLGGAMINRSFKQGQEYQINRVGARAGGQVKRTLKRKEPNTEVKGTRQ